jgi:hypothetical protein
MVPSPGFRKVVRALAPLSFHAATYSGVFTLLPMVTGEGLEPIDAKRCAAEDRCTLGVR